MRRLGISEVVPRWLRAARHGSTRGCGVIFAAAAMLALPGCETMPQSRTALSGKWGGRHVGLVLVGGLGKLEYDCASGTIDHPVTPGPGGRFTAVGTHVRGQGGPDRVGQVFTRHRAAYAGQIRGETLTLTVTLDNGTVIGPYTLRRGAQPLIHACL